MTGTPSLDPELLAAFVAVAEYQSFTRAALVLNRTQSSVSMQIKRLEERLQVELFHRTKTNVALYPQGCLFRKWAMEALEAAKRPWRLAFVSHSQGAVEAIVAQGLAVTVVKAGTFPQRLQPLSTDDGMPRLPEADICLHRAPSLSPAAALLAKHLAEFMHKPN